GESTSRWPRGSGAGGQRMGLGAPLPSAAAPVSALGLGGPLSSVPKTGPRKAGGLRPPGRSEDPPRARRPRRPRRIPCDGQLSARPAGAGRSRSQPPRPGRGWRTRGGVPVRRAEGRLDTRRERGSATALAVVWASVLTALALGLFVLGRRAAQMQALRQGTDAAAMGAGHLVRDDSYGISPSQLDGAAQRLVASYFGGSFAARAARPRDFSP